MATPTQNEVPVVQIVASGAAFGAGRGLVHGYKWGSNEGAAGVDLTFSFPKGIAHFAVEYSYLNEWSDWAQMSARETARAVKALDAWTSVSGVNATLVADNEATVGEIRFARTSAKLGAELAHAYYPAVETYSGDVWMSFEWNEPLTSVKPGSYDYLALVHEIGHALGLKHSFEASGRNSAKIPKSQDSFFHTVMSYSTKPGDPEVTSNFYPTTPMYLDLLAVQGLYGRDMQSNAGNTKYTFAAGQKYWQTIDDAGGADTIVYSGNSNCTIDLRSGKFSTLSAPIKFSDGTSTRSTVSIGPGTIIEAAKGGGGKDKLIGNAADNVLKGGVGADTLTGGAGDDRLYGDVGSDNLSGGRGDDIFVFSVRSAKKIVDTILDFKGRDDSIWFDNAAFTGLKQKGSERNPSPLAKEKFFVGARAHDSDDRIVYDPAKRALFYDADGNGKLKAVQIAAFKNKASVNHTDFFVV